MTPEVIELIKSANPSTIIDVGASDGRYSKELWPHFPEAKFILVDPIIYPNKWEGHNVEWIHKCAFDGTTVQFNPTPDGFTSGIYGEKDFVTKASVSLGELIGSASDVFLKLDTHGVESTILNDLYLYDLRAQINAIQVEVYNFKLSENCLRFPDIMRLVESRGYRLATMFDPLYRGDNALWQMDFLFLRHDHQIFNTNHYFYK
jgi:hypothetical protein